MKNFLRDFSIPRYNHSADYNTNAQSFADYLAKSNYFLKLISERVDGYDEVLQDYKDQWDENLATINQEVIDMLVVWMDDGTLAHIINEEIFNMKADKTYVDNELLVVQNFLNNLSNNKLDKTEFENSLKVVYPTGTDDTENIIQALENYDRVMLSGGDFYTAIDMVMNNKELFSKDAVIHPLTNGYALILRGDNNKIHSNTIELPASNSNRLGLNTKGNNNQVFGNEIYATDKYVHGSSVNHQGLLLINGSHNNVHDNELYNGGAGISLDDGVYNIIENNHIHDNTMGIRNSPSSLFNKILNNNIENNNVTSNSGGDGLLLFRNTKGHIVSGNHISGSGEHGIYNQGDNNLITDNVVFNNGIDGIKNGAHQTQLEGYPSGLYLSKKNIIENNIVYGNGVDGIYYQTPFEDVTIKNNASYDNGEEGIKVVVMGESVNDVLGSIDVSNNTTDSIWLAGNREVVISNNKVKGRIFTTAKTTVGDNRLIEPLIKDNIVYELNVTRTTNSKIINNTVKAIFNIIENSSSVIQGNYIVSEQDIICTRLRTWVNNRVIFKNGHKFINFESVFKAVGNYFESIYLDGEYLCTPTPNSGVILQFVNNHLLVGASGLYIETYAENALFNGNFFEGSSAGETNIRLRGKNAVVVNNTSTPTARVNFHVNGIGKNNVLSFVNPPSTSYIIEDNLE